MQAHNARLVAKSRASVVEDAARSPRNVIVDSMAQLHESHADLTLFLFASSAVEIVAGPVVKLGERHRDCELHGSR
jgi:hypothetical protein